MYIGIVWTRNIVNLDLKNEMSILEINIEVL